MSELVERVRNLPIWSGPIDVVSLQGGFSNVSFVVQDRSRRYVVRFGSDLPQHHVSRAHELMAAKAAHHVGVAPKVVYAEPGVMVSDFVPGRTFTAADVRANRQRVVSIVRTFHQAMPQFVSGTPALFWPFHGIRDYARTLEAGQSRHRHRLARDLDLATRLERALVPQPIVFGHNDLLPANILDDGERLWLIDFEYAAYSTPGFDLAGLASNAEFTPAESEALLSAYFARPPDEALMRGHSAMCCASLLREVMWSMVCELHPLAVGVDYAQYTVENLVRLDGAVADHAARFGVL